MPPSGSIRSNSLKSTGLPLASSFSARFLVASISAFDDDGMPHRAVASSRPSAPLRTIGACVVRKHARHRREVADVSVDDAKQRDDGGLVGGDRVEIAHRSGFGSRMARLPGQL